MHKSALILVAAGKGARAGHDIPKQYYSLGGKAILRHTLENCAKAFNFNTIICVIAEGDERAKDVIAKSGVSAQLVIGGKTRTKSVLAGLKALENIKPDHVYIHDAARPFISYATLDALSKVLETHEGTAPALPVTDALKRRDGSSADRDQFLRMQTPQAFHYDQILAAFRSLADGAQAADDIAIAKDAGLTLKFVDGDERNFKITYPHDFEKAEYMMAANSYTAVGSGYDVHQFEDGGTMMLCGVPIECGYRLKGHSDADAGLHALTDAIFGALGLGDIGDHFPPSDDAHKNQDSAVFLTAAIEAVRERGATLHHVDLTLICEQPKIKPHREAMRARIADLCGLSLPRVSVKATTTEKLGFTGRKEGLAAQATATLSIPS